MEKLKLEYWFGLDRASFMVLPRVFLEQMPDEWQYKMHDLLREFESTFDLGKCGVKGTTVRATNASGKLIKIPESLLNYRRPDTGFINSARVLSAGICGSCSVPGVSEITGCLYCGLQDRIIIPEPLESRVKGCMFYKKKV